jgi:hypothetical protein
VPQGDSRSWSEWRLVLSNKQEHGIAKAKAKDNANHSWSTVHPLKIHLLLFLCWRGTVFLKGGEWCGVRKVVCFAREGGRCGMVTRLYSNPWYGTITWAVSIFFLSMLWHLLICTPAGRADAPLPIDLPDTAALSKQFTAILLDLGFSLPSIRNRGQAASASLKPA